jgi:hypothetical protein
MFRWYRDAARCYVYLSDVSDQPLLVTQGHHESRWLLWIWMLSVLYTVSMWHDSAIHRYFFSRHIPYTPVSSDLVSSEQKPRFTFKKKADGSPADGHCKSFLHYP